MPPQGLNLNEYGTESWVTAPQPRNFAFLGHVCFCSTYILTGAWLDFRLAFGGEGANDSLEVFEGGMAPPPPWIRQWANISSLA